MQIDEMITKRLETAVQAIEPRLTHQVLADVNQRRRRHRQRRHAAVAVIAAIAVAAAAAGITHLAHTDSSRDLVVGSAGKAQDKPATPSVRRKLKQPASDALRRSWRALPPGPLGERLEFASAWTGSELVIWGGWNGTTMESFFSDGAAYDPARGSWRMLAPAPGPGRADAKAVWTGREVVVLGGRSGDGVLTNGLAYEPATDMWRTIASGPLDSSLPGDAVWTGSKVVLTTKEAGDAAGRPAHVLTFDPSDEVWARLSDPPAAFTTADLVSDGDRVLLFSGALDKLNSPTSPGVKIAEWYEEDSEWKSVAPLVDLLPQAFVAEAVSSSLFAVDYGGNAFVSSNDVVSWTGPSPGPLHGSDCPPEAAAVAGGLFVWQCGQAALIGPDAGWIDVSNPGLDFEYRDTAVVAAGDQILIWGRNFNAHEPAFWELSTSNLD